MLDSVIHAHELTRRFGERTAVDRLSLTVGAGEVVALLGPNGAGKTTTLRMLAGLLEPSAGRVDVGGAVGLLTESPGLWDALSIRLNLLTYARLYGVRDPETCVRNALASMDLSDRVEDRAVHLSKGLRQRVAIARALLHDPAVVLLDEPTAGLDPASARHIRDRIVEVARQGRAVLMSTHNLAEAEALAHRIAILKVRLLAMDTPAGLRRHLAGADVEIEVEGDASQWTAVALMRGGAWATSQGARLRVTIDQVQQIPDLVAALVSAGARIVRVTPESRTLEDVYLDMVGPS
jgi:ABC-2 type transport system ATP-binding protein